MKRSYIVYKVTNKFDGKIYIGCHATINNNDGYMGSGTEIKEAIKKFGKKSFVKETLATFDTKEKMLAKEKELVTKEFCMRADTYNRTEGGGTYTNLGKVPVMDEHGNTTQMYCDDPRYLSGEFVHVMSGKVTVKDKDGNTSKVSTKDPRYLSGELIHISIGREFSKEMIEKRKQTMLINPYIHSEETKEKIKNSIKEKIKKNEWKLSIDKIVVQDKDGNRSQVDRYDPRYLSGELVSIHKGMIPVKDTNGRIFKVKTNDSRYLSGELVYIHKGRIKSEETRKKISKGNIGKKMSKEAIEKISLAKRGHIVSSGTREKISNKQKGKIISCETREKISKKILQLDLNGNLIKEWVSISEAARNGFIKTAIINVCKNKSKHHYKFLWQYK